jgi:uncharacterized membrane protein (UPF0127 family)
MGIIAEQWTSDERVQLSVQRASGLARLSGLIRKRVPAEREAFLLPRCRSVHTVGMQHAIDVVFVDRDQRVCRVATVAPRRLVFCRTAVNTFELRAGEAGRLAIGTGSKLTRNPLTEEVENDG